MGLRYERLLMTHRERKGAINDFVALCERLCVEDKEWTEAEAVTRALRPLHASLTFSLLMLMSRVTCDDRCHPYDADD